MRSAACLILLGLLTGVAGCSSESTPTDRQNVPNSSGGTSSGDAAPDPSGGRDNQPASCYASCQNTGFTCQQKGATDAIRIDVTPDGTGCSGTSTRGGSTLSFKLDCAEARICVGTSATEPATTCVPGAFSAFNFDYTPAGGANTVCTRE